MSLGQIVTNVLIIASILGAAYAFLRYDLVDPRKTPSFRDIQDALKHGKPISSQWKPFDEANRTGYGIWVLCFLAFGTLIFTHDWLAHFIDQF